ncbi:MAG: hypothetical protein ABUS56_05410 [Acidobacteriota bacterium]
MHKVVFVAFFALITFNLSGLSAICEDVDCEETCPTDVSGGQCAPNCHFCSCCSLPRVTSPGAVTAPDAPVARATIWIQSSDRPMSPAPADILHVPIALGA